jgi:hypothetical protein
VIAGSGRGAAPVFIPGNGKLRSITRALRSSREVLQSMEVVRCGLDDVICGAPSGVEELNASRRSGGRELRESAAKRAIRRLQRS